MKRTTRIWFAAILALSAAIMLALFARHHLAASVSERRYLAALKQYQVNDVRTGKRQELFVQACHAMHNFAIRSPFRESRVHTDFGKPDFEWDAGSAGKTLAYLYNRNGTKDWVALIVVRNGRVSQVAFNGRDSLELSNWKAN